MCISILEMSGEGNSSNMTSVSAGCGVGTFRRIGVKVLDWTPLVPDAFPLLLLAVTNDCTFEGNHLQIQIIRNEVWNLCKFLFSIHCPIYL